MPSLRPGTNSGASLRLAGNQLAGGGLERRFRSFSLRGLGFRVRFFAFSVRGCTHGAREEFRVSVSRQEKAYQNAKVATLLQRRLAFSTSSQ